MKKHLKIISVVFLFSFLPAHLVAAASQFSCDVTSMAGTEHDPEFKRKNLAAKFLLTVSDKDIFASKISPEFEDSQTIYSVLLHKTDSNEYYGAVDSVGGVQSIYFDARNREGTLIYQGSFFATIWVLACL